MKRYLVLIGVLLFMWSCNDKKKGPTGDPADFEVEEVAVDSTDLAICEEKECPEFKVNYLNFKGDENFVTAVNKKNTEGLARVFKLEEDQAPEETVEKAFDKYLGNYIKTSEEFNVEGFEAEVEQKLKSENENTVVIQTSFYLFTGGAHGYGGVNFANFDAHSGKYLEHEDLIADKEGFTDFMEEKFRQQYEIPTDASINSKGFFFDDDKFILPENIAVTDENVELIYNPYEAASYAEGQLRFVFPKETVAKYFNY